MFILLIRHYMVDKFILTLFRNPTPLVHALE